MNVNRSRPFFGRWDQSSFPSRVPHRQDRLDDFPNALFDEFATLSLDADPYPEYDHAPPPPPPHQPYRLAPSIRGGMATTAVLPLMRGIRRPSFQEDEIYLLPTTNYHLRVKVDRSGDLVRFRAVIPACFTPVDIIRALGIQDPSSSSSSSSSPPYLPLQAGSQLEDDYSVTLIMTNGRATEFNNRQTLKHIINRLQPSQPEGLIIQRRNRRYLSSWS